MKRKIMTNWLRVDFFWSFVGLSENREQPESYENRCDNAIAQLLKLSA